MQTIFSHFGYSLKSMCLHDSLMLSKAIRMRSGNVMHMARTMSKIKAEAGGRV